jgi:hypothetical protein
MFDTWLTPRQGKRCKYPYTAACSRLLTPLSSAENFEVTLQFLLQQAAWLYDRQLSQVRAQIRKVGTTQSNSPSPAPGSVSGSTALGGQVQKDVPVTGIYYRLWFFLRR